MSSRGRLGIKTGLLSLLGSQPEVTCQLTEYDHPLFSSIHAYTADLPVNNRVKTPLELNATKTEHWHAVSNAAIGSAGSDLVITTNVFHIASRTVASGVFNQNLRGCDPLWGVRNIEEIQKVAETEPQLSLGKIRDIPSTTTSSSSSTPAASFK
ncbi:hypothetical protein EC957_002380 [Mortierella hygrophila]|uniref:Uncharacterized protein n=1 Tax=Mortierella hygrophila TaxID=979708 RepID=A0A9P6F3E5_9FUNG|nr:hypothetical protein EC957_002380 [Mortierella hygrophila]